MTVEGLIEEQVGPRTAGLLGDEVAHQPVGQAAESIDRIGLDRPVLVLHRQAVKRRGVGDQVPTVGGLKKGRHSDVLTLTSSVRVERVPLVMATSRRLGWRR
jgi:hypothetical protein